MKLDKAGYRKVLFTVAVIRMRFILPIAAFFSCAALGGGRTSAGAMMIIATVGLVLFIWGYIEWQVSSPAVTQVYEPVTYEIAEEGLLYEYLSDSGIVEWDRFSRWRLAAKHFVLQARGGRFLVLPLSAMDAETRLTFETAFRAHIRKGPTGPVASQGDDA